MNPLRTSDITRGSYPENILKVIYDEKKLGESQSRLLALIPIQVL